MRNEEKVENKMCRGCSHYVDCFDDDFKPCDKFLEELDRLNNKTYVCPRCKAFMKKNGICKKCGYTENKLLKAKGEKYGRR